MRQPFSCFPGDGGESWLRESCSCSGHRKSRGNLQKVRGTINTVKNDSLQVQRKSGCCQGRAEEERGPRGSLFASF